MVPRIARPIGPLPDPRATAGLARAVAGLVRPGDAVLLEGPLGAGKTVFARAFLRAITGDPTLEVPSPSFTLVQSYDTARGPVHHFDLWRLSGPADLAELGWQEAVDGVVLVEWPDRLGALAPAHALRITLAITGPRRREVCLAGWEARRGVKEAEALS